MNEIIKTKIERPYFDLVISYRKDNLADESVIKEMYDENIYDISARHLVQENPVVLDIGANIGTFTLLVLKIAQEANMTVTIYAVEPEKNNLELLKTNLDQNPELFQNGSKVIIIEKGLSDFNGTSFISNEAGGSRLQDNNDEMQKIEIMTYEDMVKEYSIDKIDFTKIDIEGSEIPLISAITKSSLLKSHFYAIEFDSFNKITGFIDLLKPFLNDFSFRTFGVPKNGCNLYLENHTWEK